MSLILIGYRGCGKTTVGKRLADRLWQTFVDLDDRIVQSAGKTIAEIFQQHGEPHFRDVETQCLRQVAALPDHVIALGGGTLMREENRQILKSAGHKIIYLRCDPEELLRRIQSDPASAANRPNLTSLGGGLDEIKQVLAQREPIYRQMMHAELDVTNLSPEEAMAYVARMM